MMTATKCQAIFKWHNISKLNKNSISHNVCVREREKEKECRQNVGLGIYRESERDLKRLINENAMLHEQKRFESILGIRFRRTTRTYCYVNAAYKQPSTEQTGGEFGTKF